MLSLIIGGSASGKSEYAERLVCSLPGKRIYTATMEPFSEEGRERIARHRKLREGKGFVTVEVPRNLGAFADVLWKSRAQGEVFWNVPDTEAAWEDPNTEAVREESDTEAAREDPNTEAAREESDAEAAWEDSNTEAAREESDTETVREEPKTEFVSRTYNILLEDLPNLVANELFGDGEIPVTDAERAEKSDLIFSKVIRAIEELSCISENLTIVTGDIFSGGVRYDSVTEEYRSLLAKMNCRIAEMADRLVFVTAGCPVETDAWHGINSPCKGTYTGYEDDSVIKETADMGHGDDFCIKEPDTGAIPGDFRQKTSHSEGKSGMVFVTGPLASGKRAWVQKKLGICEENIVQAAEILRECPGEEVLQENSVRKARNMKAAKSEAACVTDVQELVGKSIMTEEELEALADKLAEFGVIIACEVGGGVIPLDRGERIWRENAGRLACLLAERAEQVVLVHCGIGICIKPV